MFVGQSGADRLALGETEQAGSLSNPIGAYRPDDVTERFLEACMQQLLA
jgi:hypothetical protein